VFFTIKKIIATSCLDDLHTAQVNSLNWVVNEKEGSDHCKWKPQNRDFFSQYFATL